ncbi:uncharacterized protein LOC131647826 [Vicia villosa]|uniref:uncharacterized protein LOC131647826 n=1 Tax=Vicia villosa TaxID=3911 RepID=UPI00273C1F4D|nr:uncharacterized protein LOC131647826 [Vicia villosa]
MSRFFQGSNRRKSPFIRDECRCGLEAPLMTAWTYANPGRHFYGCGMYKGHTMCIYFVWYDEEMSPTSKELIIEKNKANEFKLKENELTMNMKFVKMQFKFIIGLSIVLLMVLVASSVMK